MMIDEMIHAFGKENVSFIPLSTWTEWVGSVKTRKDILSLISNLVKMIYFNPQHPENKCIRINKPSSQAFPEMFSMIWTGREWKEKKTYDIIIGMGYYAYTLLRDRFDGIPPPIPVTVTGNRSRSSSIEDIPEPVWPAKVQTIWNTYIDKIENYHKTTTNELYNIVWEVIEIN